MGNLLDEALDMYGMREAQATFIRHNENLTYRVWDDTQGQSFVLRIHKPADGFSPGIFGMIPEAPEMLAGELRILRAIGETSDIPVQLPIQNRFGEWVTRLSDGTLATLLSWIEGETVEKTPLTEELLFQIGEMTGKLHRFLQAWPEAKQLARPAYDVGLLERIRTKMAEDGARGFFEPRHIAVIQDTLEVIGRQFILLDRMPGTRVLAHTDLSKSNLVVTSGGVAPIDFGLCGFSHIHMDLGSLFGHFTRPEEQRLLLYGYQTIVSDIDVKYIDMFTALQVILFLTAHAEKTREWEWFETAMERWTSTLFLPVVNGGSA